MTAPPSPPSERRDIGVLMRLFRQGCGVWVSDGIVAREDLYGGIGVFVTRPLSPGEIVAKIPWTSCVTPPNAARFVGMAEDDCVPNQRDWQCIALAAAVVKASLAEFGPWSAYARSLPWADIVHPLLNPEMATEDEQHREYIEGTRRAAAEVAALTGAPLNRCYRAVLFVLSRSFDLSHVRGDGNHLVVLVPFYDLINHPSVSLVKTLSRFGDVPVSGSVSGATEDGKNLCVRAPILLELKPGDQLLGWYGNAGWGIKDPEESRRKERQFELQYGFSPWRE